MDMRPGGSERWLFPAALAAVAALVTLVLAYLTDLGSPAVINLAYYGLMGAAVGLIALRARLRSNLRGAWTLMALGLLAWMAGDAYYAIYQPTAYPSPGDGLYGLSYIALLGGMRAMGGRVRVAGFVSVALLMVVLGLATVWSWLVFDGMLSSAEGSTAAIATAAAFPMFDLMLLASALVALAARHWHLDAAFAALIGGFALLAAGDLIYTAQVTAGTYQAGNVADALWPAGAIAVAFAAWLPASFSEAGVRGNKLVPALASVAAAVAVATLVADHFDPRGTVTILLAAATLLAAMAQVALLFRGRERAAAETQAARALHGASMQAALDCVITIDQRGLIREWNDAAHRTFGYTRAEALGQEVAELIIPTAVRQDHRDGMARLAATGVGTILGKRIEVMACHARGGQFPVELAVTQVQAEPPIYTAFIRDITERRRRDEENERLAAIVRSSEDAILSKDMNGIVTAWNDGAETLYGYTAGEVIGTRVTDLLIPPERTEDEPLIDRALVKGESLAFQTQRLTKSGELLDVSLRCFPIRSLDGRVIGGSVSAHDVTDRRRREAILRRDTEGKLWRRRIEEALAHDHMVFWGQPVVDALTGALHHKELLIRMELDGEIITPNNFLPHAERTDLIADIDLWAVATGVKLGREGPVAINLSAKSLSNPRLIDRVRRELDDCGTDPAAVLFEITETAVAENLAAAQTLVRQLTEMGCGVALDDFGTGYGSFTYLKHLPVTQIKIDMSFIRGLLDDEADRRVVRSIIQTAGNFNVETVAEGVEDEATVDLLQQMGVDLLQGYHLGRPRPLPPAAGFLGTASRGQRPASARLSE
ncbi:MAG TPA: EAL domain-containing protein [Thermoleophilaceae bacterium]|nr:EAL domain-containing protein [Thermoleophilaceae bacterium]